VDLIAGGGPLEGPRSRLGLKQLATLFASAADTIGVHRAIVVLRAWSLFTVRTAAAVLHCGSGVSFAAAIATALRFCCLLHVRTGAFVVRTAEGDLGAAALLLTVFPVCFGMLNHSSCRWSSRSGGGASSCFPAGTKRRSCCRTSRIKLRPVILAAAGGLSCTALSRQRVNTAAAPFRQRAKRSVGLLKHGLILARPHSFKPCGARVNRLRNGLKSADV